MSVDVNWQTLTGGSDGAALAETIREFIHDKFQQVPLPRFIRSVTVHNFDFGKVPPEIQIKDICDPLPDFYDEDDESETENGDSTPEKDVRAAGHPPIDPHARHQRNHNTHYADLDQHARSHGMRASLSPTETFASPPFLSRAPTPGLLGGASSLSYFHMPFTAGLPGTTTPLAAVAGAQFHHGWPEAQQQGSRRQNFFESSRAQTTTSVESITPPSTADPGSRPPSQHLSSLSRPQSRSGHDGSDLPADSFGRDVDEAHLPEPSANDIQVISHIKYSGDVKLVLTASILLDYPMPSFVEIPVKLHITGISFDGISILAYIRKRAHFCFLSPEDADALLSHDLSSGSGHDVGSGRQLAGGLLEQIRVESEIGQKDGGKQVLKNVGKVEKFILEQVRRIFEEEFVYPSFWTFLV